jgi:hypothetical protein
MEKSQLHAAQHIRQSLLVWMRWIENRETADDSVRLAPFALQHPGPQLIDHSKDFWLQIVFVLIVTENLILASHCSVCSSIIIVLI